MADPRPLNELKVNLGQLHPKQGEALFSPAQEILFGGAAGGGKSHLLRIAAIFWGWQIPGLQTYIFRRVEGDLVKNHIEGPRGFRELLAPVTLSGHVEMTQHEIRFWNGSKIYLCHCKDEAHRFKYQGAEIHLLLVDELTHFTDTIYRFLRGRVRQTNLKIPKEYRSFFPRIISASNPGNIGHSFVKKAFIEPAAPGVIWRASDQEGGMSRQFIRAALSDNPTLLKDDPAYRARLRGLGSAQLVRAMEQGDWDILEGAFFSEFSRDLHVVSPFEIPSHWMRFRSMDWGSAAPFSIGWWTMASDDIWVDNHKIPRGAMVRYREWYGASGPNIGLKLPASEVARGILQRQDLCEKVTFTIADPSMFKSDGGPSLAEVFMREGVPLTPADNQRIAGWNELRRRLRGEEEGVSMVKTFSTCLDSIRTIPALQHDSHRPEDVDTHAEDHAADEWRYAVMSRAFPAEAPKPDIIVFPRPTLNDIAERISARGGY